MGCVMAAPPFRDGSGVFLFRQNQQCPKVPTLGRRKSMIYLAILQFND